METVSKERDRGTYSCMARNSRGQRAEAATSVDVIGKSRKNITFSITLMGTFLSKIIDAW